MFFGYHRVRGMICWIADEVYIDRRVTEVRILKLESVKSEVIVNLLWEREEDESEERSQSIELGSGEGSRSQSDHTYLPGVHSRVIKYEEILLPG